MPDSNKADVAQAHTTSTTATASKAEVKVDDKEPEDLEQAVIKAEIEAGQAILAANKKLQKARDALADSLNNEEDQDNKGYGVKIWAGATILQCLYCPLDVPSNEEDRMIAHMDATHPAPRGNPTHDNLGNAL